MPGERLPIAVQLYSGDCCCVLRRRVSLPTLVLFNVPCEKSATEWLRTVPASAGKEVVAGAPRRMHSITAIQRLGGRRGMECN